jgi:hypothetical protein
MAARLEVAMKRTRILVLGLAIGMLGCLALPTIGMAQTQKQTTVPIKPSVKPDVVNSDPDSKNELSEEQQLKLQQYQDAKTKSRESLSNTEKKNSDTNSTIIQNMK